MKLKLTEADKPAQKLMLSVPPEVLKHIDALPLVKKGAVTRQRAILAVLKAWIEGSIKEGASR